MKKMIALFASLVFLCSTFTLAVCEETGVSPRIASILNAWNAKDGKELRLRILDYWNEHSDGTHFSWPLNIRLGGTTVDLINEPEGLSKPRAFFRRMRLLCFSGCFLTI